MMIGNNKFEYKRNLITPIKKKKNPKEYSLNKFLHKKDETKKKVKSKYSYDKNPKRKIGILSIKYFILNNDKEQIYKICERINNMLSEIISINKLISIYSNILKKQKNDIFSLKNKPNISLASFLSRIIIYSKLEYSTLCLGLIYLNKVIENNLFLTDFNVHKLLSTSILIAIKYNEDKISNNDYYAQIFGLSLNELNQLEYQFLILMDFNLYVEQKFMKKFLKYIYKKIFNESFP